MLNTSEEWIILGKDEIQHSLKMTEIYFEPIASWKLEAPIKGYRNEKI